MTRRGELLISIYASTVQGRLHAAYLKAKLRDAHRLLRSPLRELSIALVGDKRMSDLHGHFMGAARTTDVLSFPLELDSRKRPISGEVVMCVPEARRRCRQLGTRLRHELLLYALHGMLHLSGFDDRTDRQHHLMHRKEDAILRRLGVGAVFAAKGCR